MEDKIEVGEYISTKKGIAKITNIDDLDNVAWTDRKDIYFGVIRKSGYLDWHIYDDGMVLKHSKDIIDLIAIDDYVNGMLVTEVAKNEKAINICFYNGLYANNLTLVEADIKSIVTKEQFSSVEYRLE